MMEDSGIQLLAKHLADIKLQATEERHQNTKKIKTLEHKCATYETEVEEYKQKCAHQENLIHQLRLENTKKWRISERDDWKALVDAVQTDRQRLQLENETVCTFRIEVFIILLVCTHMTFHNVAQKPSNRV